MRCSTASRLEHCFRPATPAPGFLAAAGTAVPPGVSLRGGAGRGQKEAGGGSYHPPARLGAETERTCLPLDGSGPSLMPWCEDALLGVRVTVHA